MTVAEGNGIRVYQAIAIKLGLALYAKTGRQPNTGWTPKAMLRTAGHITGQTYKRGQYQRAIADLHAWLEAVKASVH